MNTNTPFHIHQIIKAALACILVLGGCATSSRITTLSPVGPKPAGVRPAGPMQGYLKVYSATQDFNDGELMYYPHSDYVIYNSDGSRYKTVSNHLSNNDETPEVVPVNVGAYYVIAKADRDGLVQVPVVIKGGQTTIVNLEKGRKSDPDTQGVENALGVKSPSGQIVGWKANS